MIEQIRQLLDVGLGGSIFTLPPGSTPDHVERAGRLLTSTFGR